MGYENYGNGKFMRRWKCKKYVELKEKDPMGWYLKDSDNPIREPLWYPLDVMHKYQRIISDYASIYLKGRPGKKT